MRSVASRSPPASDSDTTPRESSKEFAYKRKKFTYEMLRILIDYCCCCHFTTSATAQLKSSKVSCPTFEVDLLNGRVNGLKPDRTTNEITGKFPCYTSMTEENASSKCGGMIEYKDKGLTFFTGRNYVEIGPGFKGKMSNNDAGHKKRQPVQKSWVRLRSKMLNGTPTRPVTAASCCIMERTIK